MQEFVSLGKFFFRAKKQFLGVKKPFLDLGKRAKMAKLWPIFVKLWPVEKDTKTYSLLLIFKTKTQEQKCAKCVKTPFFDPTVKV